LVIPKLVPGRHKKFDYLKLFSEIVKNWLRMLEQIKSIHNECDYVAVMAKINPLMAKGSENVSKEELAEIRALALAAQLYERQQNVVATPSTTGKRIPGGLKGKVSLPDDFNEPLDDLKDYR